MYTNDLAASSVAPFFDFAGPNRLALVKVHPGAKNPVGEGWQNNYSFNRADWEQWHAEGFNIGVHAGASGIVIFDLDQKHGGIDAVRARLNEWLLAHGVGRLPHHVTTASGGQHIFMRQPSGADLGSLTSDTAGRLVGKGIDVLVGNRQTVAPGSRVNGGTYTFHDEPIYGLPQNVFDALAPPAPIEPAPVSKTGMLDRGDVAGLVDWLAEHDAFEEYQDWVNLGMALRLAYGDDGKEIWARSHNPTVTPDVIATKWKSFATEAKPGAVKLATFIQRAWKLGWKGKIREADPRMLKGVAQLISSPPLVPDAAYPTPQGEVDEFPAPAGGFIQSSAQFLASRKPPDYLIRPIFQRRYCYSITAQTDTGKTSVAMRFAAHVAIGRALGATVTVKKGTVLYFVGENPEDVQNRWLGLCRDMDIDPLTTDVHFVSGAMHLSKVAERITSEIVEKGLNPALIIVDTSAAYFETDNESDTIQALAHAKRMRSLCQLPGEPCVLVLCHPTKNAKAEELIPRGGGSFLNEVDGNMALRRNGDTVVGEKLGKFRGQPFEPISFELAAVNHPQIVDSDGLQMPTVVARPISRDEVQRQEATRDKDDVAVLNLLCSEGAMKPAHVAKALDWRFRSQAGKEGKLKDRQAGNVLRRLKKEGLADEKLTYWTATPKGQKAANVVESAKPDGEVSTVVCAPANLKGAPFPTPVRPVTPPPMPPEAKT